MSTEKDKIENKAELITAARIAGANPDESAFWRDVVNQLDKVAAGVTVEPRKTR